MNSDSVLPGAEAGLSTVDARVRLAADGPNRLDDSKHRKLIIDFLSRFRNPLVLILLGAAAASAVTGDIASFAIITTIVLLSVLLDFAQDYRAQNAADALREKVSLTVTALRDGKPTNIPAADLVRGDIILLCAGNLVPADCRLLDSKDLFVNEALLTGEPYPAEKNAHNVLEAPRTSDSVPANVLCMGSSVVSGTGKAIATQTGRATQLGAIAHSLRKEPPPTAFTVGIRDFGLLILRVTVLLVLFVLIVNLSFHRPLLESLLFALALAVGLTPELLPMIVSVTLARGALRMAAKKVIVKRLSAIHDLGSMDVLCSDKTGTLTEAHISLVREVDLMGADSAHVLELAYLNATFETGIKSPLDDAILELKNVNLEGWIKIDEVPFDFERRRVSVLLEHLGKRILVVKGAPEDVLKLASHYQPAGNGLTVPLDDASRETALKALETFGSQGFRLLGIASRDVEPTRVHAKVDDETDLTFAGFAVFVDPPKDDARTALDRLAQLGVSVKIVTGDNEHVTRHVCDALGIQVAGLLTGSEISKLSDEALSGRLEKITIFARVTPSQKSRIVRALRHRGHVVGYLGDGINDAPSLQAADVGLSVNDAVDVAKEAAAMILLERDLGVLAEGVREGRRTFTNIMKYVMMGTSSNFGNMFSMAGGVLFLPFLPMLPIQILLNNLLYDISEIAIPMDRVDDEMIARPRHWDIRFVRNFMLALGPISSAFDFMTFALLIWVFEANQALFHTGWFIESLATQALVIFVIRTRGKPWKSHPHPLLAASSLSVVCMAIVLPYTPIGEWFGFVPVPLGLLISLGTITSVYLFSAEQAKRWFYSKWLS